MLISFKLCVELVRLIHGITISNIYHIGAHEGQEAESYANGGAEKVVWFEANNAIVDGLIKNLSKFQLQSQVIPHALWNKTTELDFKIMNFDQSSSLFDLEKHLDYYPGIHVKEIKRINAYRMDSLLDLKEKFIEWSDFEFINIDTQGAELAILQGFGNYLKKSHLKAIYLEVNKESLYKDIPMVTEIDAFLNSFEFHRIKTIWTGAGWGDALYIRSNTEMN